MIKFTADLGGGKTLIGLGLSEINLERLPAPFEIVSAISKAFLKIHQSCSKSSTTPQKTPNQDPPPHP